MYVIQHFALCVAVASGLWAAGTWMADAAPVNAQFRQFQGSQFPAPKIKKPEDEEGPRLPSGKLQRDAIIEHDHKKNLEDLREIQKLTEELLEEMEANTGYVFSVGSLKKMEQLEKLSKQVKNRFKKH